MASGRKYAATSMMYLKWLILSVLGIAVTLANVLLSPVIALFINKDGYLPGWLSWFQTPDNPAIGDALFQGNQMAWTKSRYLYGVFWAIRNPGYGYDALAGAKVTADYRFTTNCPDGLEWVGDTQHGTTAWNSTRHFVEGTLFRTLETNGVTYWEFVWIKCWTPAKYSRIKLGWALWSPFTVGQVRNLEVTISPWMNING